MAGGSTKERRVSSHDADRAPGPPAPEPHPTPQPASPPPPPPSPLAPRNRGGARGVLVPPARGARSSSLRLAATRTAEVGAGPDVRSTDVPVAGPFSSSTQRFPARRYTYVAPRNL